MCSFNFQLLLSCIFFSFSDFNLALRLESLVSLGSALWHWKNTLVSRNCQNAWNAWMNLNETTSTWVRAYSRTQPKSMKNLVDSLTASLAPRPWDQDGPAAALSALSAASILPVGGMATAKTSNGCGTTIRTACKFDICKSAAGMVTWKGITLKIFKSVLSKMPQSHAVLTKSTQNSIGNL